MSIMLQYIPSFSKKQFFRRFTSSTCYLFIIFSLADQYAFINRRSCVITQYLTGNTLLYEL